MRQFFIVLALTANIFGYSYTAAPGIIMPKGSFCFNPYIFANDINSGGLGIFAGYSATDNIDLWSAIITYNGETSFSQSIRYDIKNNNIIALVGNQYTISPQYHTCKENDKVYLQVNAAVQFTYDYMDRPAIYGVIAPGIKFLKIFDIFCEINPGYYMREGDFANLSVREEGTAIDIVPGLGIILGDTYITLSVPVYNVGRETLPTFGAWWAFTLIPK